jgi:hypothetical protein
MDFLKKKAIGWSAEGRFSAAGIQQQILHPAELLLSLRKADHGACQKPDHPVQKALAFKCQTQQIAATMKADPMERAQR